MEFAWINPLLPWILLGICGIAFFEAGCCKTPPFLPRQRILNILYLPIPVVQRHRHGAWCCPGKGLTQVCLISPIIHQKLQWGLSSGYRRDDGLKSGLKAARVPQYREARGTDRQVRGIHRRSRRSWKRALGKELDTADHTIDWSGVRRP